MKGQAVLLASRPRAAFSQVMATSRESLEVSQPAFSSAGFNSPSGRRWGLKVTLAKARGTRLRLRIFVCVCSLGKATLHLQTRLHSLTSNLGARRLRLASGRLERSDAEATPSARWGFRPSGLPRRRARKDVSQHEPTYMRISSRMS